MKKYILSIFAVVLAVGMVAFSAPEKRNVAATHVFEFDGTVPGGFTEENVQDQDNWIYVGESEPLCTGSNKACRILVSDDYLDPMDSEKLSGVTISTSLTAGKAIVTGITNYPENQFSNQP